MKVLSLFDGMACGMLAMKAAGVEVTDYDAYEIDKYAMQVATHNFPGIREHGDVFKADFTQYKGVDFVVGGSPCTYWSIAQTKNRETEAHGIGWELFQQYVRAVREAEPRFFIYENNKSMSEAIRKEISETFGFEPICINSALVSAQNRQRLYWVGVRQEDGTYRKADIEQPDDRGILLKDVLDDGITWRDKSHCIDANYYKGGNLSSMEKQSGKRLMVAEPMKSLSEREIEYMVRSTKDGRNHFGFGHYHDADKPKSACVTSNISKGVPYNVLVEPIRVGSLPRPNGELSTSQAMRVYSDEGKGVGLKACGGGMGGKTGLYAIPICHTIPQEVSVRKYTCNIEDLKTLLRDNKTMSNKEIAEALDKPVTMVEHWFRTDNCFSVPDADVWFKLKELLGITSTEFDDFVMVFETREGVFEKSHRCYDSNGKMSTLTTGSSDNIIHPILLNPKNEEGSELSLLDCIYSADGKSTTVTGGFHPSVCVREVRGMSYDLKEVYDADSGVVARLDMPRCHDILTRVYGENGKSPTITAQGGGNVEPKVFSSTESVKSTTETPVYEVKDGMISIKGKQYPIKLADGHYIIRKLTVDECKRLQTVPEWYDMTCISNTQAYKCLGNGWTIEVIAHLIRGALGTDCKEPSVSAKPYAQTNLDRYIGGC